MLEITRVCTDFDFVVNSSIFRLTLIVNPDPKIGITDWQATCAHDDSSTVVCKPTDILNGKYIIDNTNFIYDHNMNLVMRRRFIRMPEYNTHLLALCPDTATSNDPVRIFQIQTDFILTQDPADPTDICLYDADMNLVAEGVSPDSVHKMGNYVIVKRSAQRKQSAPSQTYTCYIIYDNKLIKTHDSIYEYPVVAVNNIIYFSNGTKYTYRAPTCAECGAIDLQIVNTSNGAYCTKCTEFAIKNTYSI